MLSKQKACLPMPLVHWNDFFQKYNSEMVQAWSQARAHCRHCYFSLSALSLLGSAVVHLHTRTGLDHGDKAVSILPPLSWVLTPVYKHCILQPRPFTFVYGIFDFFFKDGQLWIGWNLFFRLWAECMFPFNNYTERLKFQKEVCWGLWVIKMEYFYPVTSSWPPYTHTSSSYWYLSHVKILLLDS